MHNQNILAKLCSPINSESRFYFILFFLLEKSQIFSPKCIYFTIFYRAWNLKSGESTVISSCCDVN